MLVLLGGIWAARRIRDPEVRARADRTPAIWLSSAVGIVGGLLITIAVGSIAVMFSNNAPSYAIGLPFGIGIGALLGLAGILGYSILARPRFGRIALAGTLLGPGLLIGTTALANSLALGLSQAQFENEEAQHAAEVAARSASLHVAVEHVEVDTARSGAVVAAVRVQVRLSTDVGVSFDPALKEPDPHFVLNPPDPLAATVLDAFAPPGSPTSIGAGQSHLYEVAFRYTDEMINATQGTYRAGSPGMWTLEVSFNDPAAGDYEARLPVELR